MASKKAVLVYILEILKSETDANHTLSQEEIRSILAERYEVSVDRKTLGRHLMIYMNLVILVFNVKSLLWEQMALFAVPIST